MSCVYTYPLPSIEESNETLINKKIIRVLECQNNIDVNSLCNLWNFSHCPNDDDYCQPFIKGDIIRKQYIAPNGYYFKTFIHIIDTKTGLDIVNIMPYYTTEVGNDDKENVYANILVDTNLLDTTECFYFKIVAFSCHLNQDQTDEYNDCWAELVAQGYTANQAKEICLTDLCPNGKDVMYSEPYCIEKCQPTILIQGFYPNYDCNYNFYGDFIAAPVTNSYIPQIRIHGVMEPSEFIVEEVTVNNIRKSTKLIETANLLSKKLPYYVVQQLANIFASQKVSVDGVEYLRALNLIKNNDEGMMWIIRTTLSKECEITNFTCDQ